MRVFRRISVALACLTAPWALAQPVNDCLADWNDSGTINSTDYNDFLTDYGNGVAYCDLNIDGSINSQDVLKFSSILYGNRLPAGTLVVYMPQDGHWDEDYIALMPWETINGFVFDSYTFVYLTDVFERDTTHQLDQTWSTSWGAPDPGHPFAEALKLKEAYDDYKVITDSVVTNNTTFGNMIAGTIEAIGTGDDDYLYGDAMTHRVWQDRIIYLFPPSVTTGLPAKYADASVNAGLVYLPEGFYPHYIAADIFYDQMNDLSYTTTGGFHELDEIWYNSNQYYTTQVWQDSNSPYGLPDLQPFSNPKRKFVQPVDIYDPFGVRPEPWKHPPYPLVKPRQRWQWGPLLKPYATQDSGCDDPDKADRPMITGDPDYGDGIGTYMAVPAAEYDDVCGFPTTPLLVITVDTTGSCDVDDATQDMIAEDACTLITHVWRTNLDHDGVGHICLDSVYCEQSYPLDTDMITMFDGQWTLYCGCTID